MSFEVEVKYRSDDHAALERLLRELGAQAEGSVAQEDVYLSHPSRDFAATNEALRVRRIGSENRITYKGPRHAGPTKTREEIEIRFEDGTERFESLVRLFDQLGFRTVATIRKTRRPFHLEFQGRPAEVALDDAEDLGRFAEVEVLAAEAGDLPKAQEAVLRLAEKLGLSKVEPRSYLTMALERQRTAPSSQPSREAHG